MKEEECDAHSHSSIKRHNSGQKSIDDISKDSNRLPDILFKLPKKSELTCNIKTRMQHHIRNISCREPIDQIAKYLALFKPSTEKKSINDKPKYESRNKNNALWSQFTLNTSKILQNCSSQIINNTSKNENGIAPLLMFDVTSFNKKFNKNITYCKDVDMKKRNSAKLTTLKMLWKQKEFVDQQIHILQVQKSKLSDQIQKASAKMIFDKS